jgi:hypothetical protein
MKILQRQLFLIVLFTLLNVLNLKAQIISANLGIGYDLGTNPSSSTMPSGLINRSSAQLGASIEKKLWKRHLVSTLVGLNYYYYYRKFSFVQDYFIWPEYVSKENSYKFYYSNVSLPLRVRKYFRIKGFKPYIEAGYNFRYSISVKEVSNTFNPINETYEKATDTIHPENFKDGLSSGKIFGIGIESGKFQISIARINNKFSKSTNELKQMFVNVAYIIR